MKLLTPPTQDNDHHHTQSDGFPLLYILRLTFASLQDCLNDCIYQIERTKEEANLCHQLSESPPSPPVSKVEKVEGTQTKEKTCPAPSTPPDSPELKSQTPTEVFNVDLNEQFRSWQTIFGKNQSSFY